MGGVNSDCIDTPSTYLLVGEDKYVPSEQTRTWCTVEYGSEERGYELSEQ